MAAARYYPYLGGTETHIHEVGKRMVALGHQVSVITTDPAGTLPKYAVDNGITVTRVRAWPRSRDYYFSPNLYKKNLARRMRHYPFSGLSQLRAADRHIGGYSKACPICFDLSQWGSFITATQRYSWHPSTYVETIGRTR